VASIAYGALYLIPVTLGNDDIAQALPPAVVSRAQMLDTFIVENEKTARRFLGAIKTTTPVRELTLLTLNEHTKAEELPALIAPLLAGKDVGLISEAGCPGVADPGAQVVALAHRHHIRVVPLVGPSSILLALMASGLNGQRFAFLGYLPSEKAARVQRLKEIEKASHQHNETQVFIETPYRNQHMLEDVIATCHPETRLCVACNLTLENEQVISRSIREWRAVALPDIHKQPSVFLLLA
jgi:16S rRNA (cytidine1402-2'-O)-methyltransferase